jgi:hypothetical protein
MPEHIMLYLVFLIEINRMFRNCNTLLNVFGDQVQEHTEEKHLCILDKVIQVVTSWETIS